METARIGSGKPVTMRAVSMRDMNDPADRRNQIPWIVEPAYGINVRWVLRILASGLRGRLRIEHLIRLSFRIDKMLSYALRSI